MGSPQMRVPGYRKTLFGFTVLRAGWEMDDTAWVVQMKDGGLEIVMTNHGGPYIAQKSEIEEKITEYHEAIAASLKALSMIDAALKE